MKARTPAAKAGIFFLGLIVAFVSAWVAVDLRQRAMRGTPDYATGAMYAFGDLLFGVAVFGVVALVPLGLALYWLRPVARFWSALLSGALTFAVTGPVAVAMNHWSQGLMGGWDLLANARFGIMPLSALALLTCAAFAPQSRQRWSLLAAGLTDGALFAGVVVVKFLPALAANG